MTYRAALVVFIGLSLALPDPVWAQERTSQAGEGTKKKGSAVAQQETLSLDAVVRSSLEHHPLIRAVVEERNGVAGELLSSQGAFDRLIRGDFTDYATGGYSGSYYNVQAEQPFQTWGSRLVAGYRQSTGTFPIYDDYYNTNQNGEIRAGVEVPLFRDRDTDKRRTAINKATLQQDVADLAIALRKIDLGRAAANAYWEWVGARRKLAVYQDLFKVAKERDDQLVRRATVGDLAVFDQTDNRRQVLQRETQVLSAQRAVQKAEFELSFFFRSQEGAPINVNASVPPSAHALLKPAELTDVEGRVASAHRQRPELKRLQQLVAQQELELTLAKNDLLPKVDLGSYVARDMGAGKQDRNETELKLGLKLEIPLQTRNQQGRIEQYSAKKRELEAQAESLRDRIRVEVQDAVNSIVISRDRVDVARNELKLAQDLEKGERSKFVQGDSNLIFVNLREQTTADAAVRAIDTELEFQKAVVAFHAALGETEYVSR